MRAALLCAFLVAAAVLCVNGRHARIKQGKETWGYVSVRKGAHMFFWLYYTTADVDYTQRPLVVWLQGGPGASSTGIGNFLEIGPQDANLHNRTNAWTEHVNVLFIDNPVGTGFSYVDDPKLLAKNNTEIATDLVEFMKGFFVKVPEFQNVPVYIFAESYGGKMAVKFAQSLNKAVQQKKVSCQVAGVALGDSWVSPVDSVLSWGPYLYSMSLVDSVGLKAINAKTASVRDAVREGRMKDATQLWAEAEKVVENVTNGVNFFNILTRYGDGAVHGRESNHIGRSQPGHSFSSDHLASLYHRHVGVVSSALAKLMNGPVREKLKVIPENVTWGGQSPRVFEALAEDFMQPAVLNVEALLNTTSLTVVVYNGQLDLIVDTPGVESWVEKMHWAGTQQWVSAPRRPMESKTGETEAFSKAFKNFNFYWILKAGHMVPADAAEVSIKMLKQIVGIKQD